MEYIGRVIDCLGGIVATTCAYPTWESAHHRAEKLARMSKKISWERCRIVVTRREEDERGATINIYA